MDEKFIDIAIEISRKAKYPYGAIVVKYGEIIGRSDDKTLMETSMYSHAELEATKPLLSKMNHNQKVQMMMTSNYRQVFSEYFENIETLNRYIRKSYSGSSDLLIDRFAKYDSISTKKVNTLSNELINGNTKELAKIKEELDENSLFARFNIPSAE